MPLVGLPPAFVPPVVAVPAANAIVPFVAGTAAAGGGAAVASAVAAPLLVGALAGVAALGVAYGVAQLWGLVNNAAAPPVGWGPPTPTSYTEGTAVAPAGGGGLFSVYWYSTGVAGGERAFTSPQGVTSVAVQRTYYEVESWVGQKGWAWRIEGFDAAGVEIWSRSITLNYVPGAVLFDGPTVPNIPLTSLRLRYEVPSQGGVDLEIAPFQPETSRQLVPETLPEPAKAPPVVVPLPYAPPATPEAEPTREPAPAQPARPTIAPPVVRPAPVPPAQTPERTTPTTPAGQVQPAPQPPPAKTPSTVHVINGTQIPANGPQATPQSMAQELGRIENKLAAMLDPKRAPTSDNPDRLGELLRTALNIYEILVGLTGEGSYTLSSPCELDANGDRIVQKVEYGAALSSVGLISNKLDALALLLQKHKDLKQPICRVTPSTGGQSVTVNFVQID